MQETERQKLVKDGWIFALCLGANIDLIAVVQFANKKEFGFKCPQSGNTVIFKTGGEAREAKDSAGLARMAKIVDLSSEADVSSL